MNLAIVGTRNPGVSYQEWETLLLSKVNVSDLSLIVSGGAKGIDTYAKRFAARHHIPLMGYTSTTVTIKHGSTIYVCGEHGEIKFTR